MGSSTDAGDEDLFFSSDLCVRCGEWLGLGLRRAVSSSAESVTYCRMDARGGAVDTRWIPHDVTWESPALPGSAVPGNTHCVYSQTQRSLLPLPPTTPQTPLSASGNSNVCKRMHRWAGHLSVWPLSPLSARGSFRSVNGQRELAGHFPRSLSIFVELLSALL